MAVTCKASPHPDTQKHSRAASIVAVSASGDLTESEAWRNEVGFVGPVVGAARQAPGRRFVVGW